MTLVRYIDAHCHLQFDSYAPDREEIIAQMREQGVAAIVVGDDEESSRAAVALAEAHAHLFAAVGIHPEHIKDIGCPSSELGHPMSKLRELAQRLKVAAIGECGLDYFRMSGSEIKRAQKELFRKHLALAAELDKPLMVHVRSSEGTGDAYQDAIGILREAKRDYPNLRGNIHFFAGTQADAEAFFSLGFTISFTAVITFARAYDAVIRAVPLASILAETDAPFVAPANRRGQRNNPLAVIDVVAKIADIRNEDPEIVRVALLANTRRLFSF